MSGSLVQPGHPQKTRPETQKLSCPAAAGGWELRLSVGEGGMQHGPDPQARWDRHPTAFRESERPPRAFRHRATRTCVRGLLPKPAGLLAAAPPNPLAPGDGMEKNGMERDGLRPPRTRTTPDS